MAQDQFDDSPFRQRGVAQEGYDFRRGKFAPFAVRIANSAGVGAMGPGDMADLKDRSKKILDEALR